MDLSADPLWLSYGCAGGHMKRELGDKMGRQTEEIPDLDGS